MTIWQRKLLAYLHDPPHKPFRIAGHEDARATPLHELGLTEQDMEQWERQQRPADWSAAAADRFPFPRDDVLFVDWKADGQLEFRHPLCGVRWIPVSQPRAQSHIGEDWVTAALKGIPTDDLGWKKKFFRVWRLWPERCAREKNPLLAYLVADTRIPDHTLWHHNGLVSALDSAGREPAFLLFQIGPVQDFIKQARKLQDLWSGSYLLSFLISRALAAVADEVGPDAVIYPSLRGVPLLDWWWSQEKGLFPDGFFELGQGRLHPNELLTPSLPNRFLALVPAGQRGTEIGRKAESAVSVLWQEIADKVHAEICHRLQAQLDRFKGWDDYWNNQVRRFPVIDWSLHPWPSEKQAFDLVAASLDATPPLPDGWPNHPLHHAALWRDMIPPSHRESWHGQRNDAFAWALHYAVTDWKFAAGKNARSFDAWAKLLPADEDDAKRRHAPPKDHLNGRDEVLGGVNHDDFWKALRDAFDGADKGDFKGRQLYGAITVIKRLWPRAYLGSPKESGGLSWKLWKPGFDSVQDIAEAIDADPDQWRSEGRTESETKKPTYYAVLCMDGDDMGQWVSGTKTPPLMSALALKAQDYFCEHWQPIQSDYRGSKVEWQAIDKVVAAKNGQPEKRPVQRPLAPGYHAALSEALSNFGLYCAGQIVEAFSGQLIYAGGDDVVAMLPAANALDCAHALQLAFRGELPEDAPDAVKRVLRWAPDNSKGLFEFPAPGFIHCKHGAGHDERLRPNWPLLVPGPRATASTGLAIGHVHAPMQDTIQAARDAEQAAKKVPGKAAFCLTILKRSGESVEFAACWSSGVAGVWAELEANPDRLSGRFAYRYIQLLRPLLALSGQDADEGWMPRWNRTLVQAVTEELRHIHYQQSESGDSAQVKRRRALEQSARWIHALIGEPDEADRPEFKPHLSPRGFIHFWMAWAFVNRLARPEA